MTNPKIDEHLHTLELSRGASVSDIVLAYRKLAFKFHPDRKGGSTEKFKKMKAAFEWLETNYEKELSLEQATANVIKKEEPVMWSSFSDKPNPNDVRTSSSQQFYFRKPYVYPSNVPKWNGATTLDNDWEVTKYEQNGELDRQMVGNFGDWNMPSSPQAVKKDEEKKTSSNFWSNYKI